MSHPDSVSQLQLPLLLGALSVGCDLATDQPSGATLRSAHIGVVIAEQLALPPEMRVDVFYASVVRFLGSTAGTHEASPPGPGEQAGEGRSSSIEEIALAQREVALRLAARLGMNEAIRVALAQMHERWDGSGFPEGTSGEKLSLITRIVQVGAAAEVFLRSPERRVRDPLREHLDSAFDPRVVDACTERFDELVEIMCNTMLCGGAISRLPPAEPPTVTLEQIAMTFADYADLKSVYRVGHSHGVAELAVAAGEALDLEQAKLTQLRLAALLHDVGIVTVPTRILDCARPLSVMEQEKIRLHPYYTSRLLSLSPFDSLAKLAGAHHERADASGYPAGVPGSTLSMMSRLLAAADVYHALTERRPHREAFAPSAAEERMQEEVTAGRLDQTAVAAVLLAVGRSTSRSSKPPSLLTSREALVLRAVAVGKSDKEIAAELGISPRTVHHHVGAVYRKIGVSSRAAAALYAVETGLLAG